MKKISNMEVVITQRFQYAEIIPFKNYSNINEKPRRSKYDAASGNFGLTSAQPNNTHRIVFIPKGKKKTKYFHNDNECTEHIDLKYARNYSDVFDSHNTFYTTDDRHIKDHYAAPFSRVGITTVQRSIIRYEDKITIKIYRQVKVRDANHIYYHRSFYINSLTINLKTGNFTVTAISKNRKESTKKFRTNNFTELHELLVMSYGFIRYGSPRNNLNTEFNEKFSDYEFDTAISNALGIIYAPYRQSGLFLLNQLREKFIRDKKIKVPDFKCNDIFNQFYPTEKFLKKNDRKLIASVLDMFGIKSNATIKIVHKNPDISIPLLAKACYFFGKDYPKYISSIHDECLGTNTDNIFYKAMLRRTLELKGQTIDVNANEKTNIAKLLNDYVKFHAERGARTGGNDSFLNTLYDHFDMMKLVRQYDPTIQLRSRCIREFNREHQELSKIVGTLKRGTVIQYEFDPDTAKVIENPIGIFYPIILKREEEYIEEGMFMYHCVATYANRENSVIVSLRTKNGDDRVTCEYDAYTGRCIQAQHFCDKTPPKHFNDALTELHKRAASIARKGKLKSINKKRVPTVINGVELTVPDLQAQFLLDQINNYEVPIAQY